MKKYLKFIISSLISIVLLFFAFQNIQLNSFQSQLSEIAPISILLYLFFILLNCTFRTILWKYTTKHLGEARYVHLFGGIVTGLLVNNFMPFRLGELYRTYYFASKTGFSKMSILSTIGIERLLDIISLFILFFVGLLFGLKELNQNNNTVIVILFVCLIVIISIIIYSIETIIAHVDKNTILSMKAKRMIINLLKPLKQFYNVKSLIIFLILSILIWGSLYLSNFFLLGDISKGDARIAFLLLIFLYFGLIIPASPGGLGVVQVAFIFALSFFGIARGNALTLSIAYQGLYYAFTIVFGIPFILLSGIHFFKDKKNESQKEKIK